MKKLALIALLAASSNVVLAGDVGAHNPQIASIALNNIAIAVSEAGASTSWATRTFEVKADNSQVKEFQANLDKINEKVQRELEMNIEKNLETLLAK